MKVYGISHYTIISILLALLSFSGLVYADRYVSVDAAADGDGSFEKPWRFVDSLQQVVPDGEPIFVNGSSSTAYTGPMHIGNRSIFIGYNGTPRASAIGEVFTISNSTILHNFEIDKSLSASNGIALRSGVSGINLSSIFIHGLMNNGIISSKLPGSLHSNIIFNNSLTKDNEKVGVVLYNVTDFYANNISCIQNGNGGLILTNAWRFNIRSLNCSGNGGSEIQAGCTFNDSYSGTLDSALIEGNAGGGLSLYNSSFITINSSIFRDHSTGFDFYGDTFSHDIHLNNIKIGGDTGANVTAVNMSKGFGFATPASIPPSPSYNASLGVYVDIITGPDSSFDQLSLHYDEAPIGYPEENIRIMKYSGSFWSDVPSHVDTAKKYVSFNGSGSISPGISTYGVFVRHSPPSIHYISPNVTYLNQSIFYVDVFGSSFNESAVVEIDNGTFSQMNVSSVQFVNNSYLNASFQMEGFVSGLYGLKVKNPDLQSSNLIPFIFTVPCPSVSANISMNISGGVAPLTVSFTDSSLGGTITNWTWTFGDGNSSVFESPEHTFTIPGTYQVNLTAGNDCGQSGSVSSTIEVLDDPCPSVSANFSGNISGGVAPLTVSFTDSSLGGTITNWTWTFGDGNSSVFESPEHTFTIPGTYQVNLTAGNDCGQSGSVFRTIEVLDTPCPSVSANISMNISGGVAPLTVSFTDSSLGGTITNWTWTFGDGNSSVFESPEHTFTIPGTYQVNLTAGNDCGQSGSVSSTIEVLDDPCPSVSANFSGNISGGVAPLTVSFTDSSNGGSLTTRSWNFGDGSVNQTGSSVMHTFAQSGDYSVTLFVLNDCGNVGMKTETIHVFAPVPVCPSINASFTSNLSSGTAPLTVSFTDSSTGGNLTTRSWNFGDGSLNQSGTNVVHTFAQSGNYSVTLFVLNDCGNVGMKTETIHVFAPVPVCPSINASFTSNLSSGTAPLTVSFTESSTGGNLTTENSAKPLLFI